MDDLISFVQILDVLLLVSFLWLFILFYKINRTRGRLILLLGYITVFVSRVIDYYWVNYVLNTQGNIQQGGVELYFYYEILGTLGMVMLLLGFLLELKDDKKIK